MTGSWTKGWPISEADHGASSRRGRYEARAVACRTGRPPGETAVLADGFSCRTQIQAGHLGREGIHLAQLLAELTGNRSN